MSKRGAPVGAGWCEVALDGGLPTSWFASTKAVHVRVRARRRRVAFFYSIGGLPSSHKTIQSRSFDSFVAHIMRLGARSTFIDFIVAHQRGPPGGRFRGMGAVSLGPESWISF